MYSRFAARTHSPPPTSFFPSSHCCGKVPESRACGPSCASAGKPAVSARVSFQNPNSSPPSARRQSPPGPRQSASVGCKQLHVVPRTCWLHPWFKRPCLRGGWARPGLCAQARLPLEQARPWAFLRLHAASRAFSLRCRAAPSCIGPARALARQSTAGAAMVAVDRRCVALAGFRPLLCLPERTRPHSARARASAPGCRCHVRW